MIGNRAQGSDKKEFLRPVPLLERNIQDKGGNLSCIFPMKNGVLLSDESECGNCVEPWAKHFLAESSDKGPSTQHLRPNLQSIYHVHWSSSSRYTESQKSYAFCMHDSR